MGNRVAVGRAKDERPEDLPAGVRHQLLQGTWDGTRVLLDAGDRIRETAARLPYVRGFGK